MYISSLLSSVTDIANLRVATRDQPKHGSLAKVDSSNLTSLVPFAEYMLGHTRYVQAYINELHDKRPEIRVVQQRRVAHPARVLRFLERAKEIVNEHPETTVQVDITFHGTRQSSVENIIQGGFRMPEVGFDGHALSTGHRPINGSKWGVGIYSSPDITTAHHYGNQDIFLCAVVLGNRFPCDIEDQGNLAGVIPGFHSHIWETGDCNEWVVFDSRQIIPLWHLEIAPREKVERL
jgi:Poly(ADP-ribose) polymerase catalytic domain